MSLDERLTIATPEGVDLELVLTGVGSRFPAAVLDAFIELVIIVALSFVIGSNSGAGNIGLAFYFVAILLVVFGYDIAFETLNHGRTPGKVAAGLRVLQLDGSPVGFFTSAVRNVLRIIDFLPLFYAVGVVAMIATRKRQRLGDMAAGTVVVRDRRRPSRPGASRLDIPSAPVDVEAVDPYAMWDVATVTTQEVGVVEQFLDRRATLTPPARSKIGTDLAARLRPKVKGAPEGLDAESFLEALAAAKDARR
jgi:uncharacterized RDD family membrane protein YckC